MMKGWLKGQNVILELNVSVCKNTENQNDKFLPCKNYSSSSEVSDEMVLSDEVREMTS